MFVPQSPPPPAAPGRIGLLGRLGPWGPRLGLAGAVLVLVVLMAVAGWYLFWPVPDARTTAEGYIGENFHALSGGLAELALPGDDRQDELAERILDDFEHGDVAWGCRNRDGERDRGSEVEVTCVVRVDVRRPLLVYLEAPLSITVDMDRDAFRPSPEVSDAVLLRRGMLLEVEER